MRYPIACAFVFAHIHIDAKGGAAMGKWLRHFRHNAPGWASLNVPVRAAPFVGFPVCAIVVGIACSAVRKTGRTGYTHCSSAAAVPSGHRTRPLNEALVCKSYWVVMICVSSIKLVAFVCVVCSIFVRKHKVNRLHSLFLYQLVEGHFGCL